MPHFRPPDRLPAAADRRRASARSTDCQRRTGCSAAAGRMSDFAERTAAGTVGFAVDTVGFAADTAPDTAVVAVVAVQPRVSSRNSGRKGRCPHLNCDNLNIFSCIYLPRAERGGDNIF